MPRPVPAPIARAVRPFLGQVVDLCSKSTLTPGDLVLLLGKYSSEETFLIPRANTSEILERAKTPARRQKTERLLASARGPHDLLVMVCAGDHVEGHFVRVPTVVPDPVRPLTETPPCACGCGAPAEIDFQGLYYKDACLHRTMNELREMGLPIEQNGNAFRLAPTTRVSFLLDDPETKKPQ